MSTPAPEINRATPELVALAIAVRPDWEEDFVSGAITAAATGGMTWEQVLTALPRLMVDPAARPRDLTRTLRAIPSQREQGPKTADGETWRRARAALDQQAAEVTARLKAEPADGEGAR